MRSCPTNCWSVDLPTVREQGLPCREGEGGGDMRMQGRSEGGHRRHPIRGVECGAHKDSGVREGKVGSKEGPMLRKQSRERPKTVSTCREIGGKGRKSRRPLEKFPGVGRRTGSLLLLTLSSPASQWPRNSVSYLHTSNISCERPSAPVSDTPNSHPHPDLPPVASVHLVLLQPLALKSSGPSIVGMQEQDGTLQGHPD